MLRERHGVPYVIRQLFERFDGALEIDFFHSRLLFFCTWCCRSFTRETSFRTENVNMNHLKSEKKSY